MITFNTMMEKNTDVCHEEQNRQINESSDNRKVDVKKLKNREKCKRYREKKKNEVTAPLISESFDLVEKIKEEERRQKNREKTKRYREKKKNEVATLPMGGSSDSDEKKREERKQKNREKTRRYREKKKNEVGALSMATADSSSDSSVTIMERERQKQRNAEKCKRYRDKKRISNLLQWQNISICENVLQQIHSSQIMSPGKRDVPNVPPLNHISQIAGPSTRYNMPYLPLVLQSPTIADPSSKDAPYISPNHSSNEEEIKQNNRENNKQCTENIDKKNEIEVAVLSMATADACTKMEQARYKEKNTEECKNTNLETQNVSNHILSYLRLEWGGP